MPADQNLDRLLLLHFQSLYARDGTANNTKTQAHAPKPDIIIEHACHPAILLSSASPCSVLHQAGCCHSESSQTSACLAWVNRATQALPASCPWPFPSTLVRLHGQTPTQSEEQYSQNRPPAPCSRDWSPVAPPRRCSSRLEVIRQLPNGSPPSVMLGTTPWKGTPPGSVALGRRPLVSSDEGMTVG